MDTRSKGQKIKQVKREIEFKIINGEYQSGDRIPSIRDISRLYPIGVASARIVLLEMCEENTIVLDQGIGYKVSNLAANRLMKKYQKEFYGIFSQVCEDAIKIGINPLELVQEITNKIEVQ